MANLNKIMIVGRLTRSPKLSEANGKSVCEFSVAVNEKWKDKQGQDQERAEFFEVVVWGKLGELCNQYLSSGREIYVEGSQKTDNYEKDGVKKSRKKLLANTVQFLSGDKKEQESAF